MNDAFDNEYYETLYNRIATLRKRHDDVRKNIGRISDDAILMEHAERELKHIRERCMTLLDTFEQRYGYRPLTIR